MKPMRAIYEGKCVVNTLAGTGKRGSRDGRQTEAEFYRPSSVAIDDENNIFVADSGNKCLRKISAIDGIVSTIAIIGTDAIPEFHCPSSIAMRRNGDVIVADALHFRVCAVSPATGIITTVAGCGEKGFLDGPVHETAFGHLFGVAVDLYDNIIVSDHGNRCIRIISAAHACTWTIAGCGEEGYRDGASRTAQFSNPSGVAVGPTGDIFVADCGNHCIRKINVAAHIVSTVAGTGKSGWRDGDVEEAQFHAPVDVAVDAHARIYVADSLNNCIRRIDPACGRVVTIAGTGERGFLYGIASAAKFSTPYGIDVNDGVLYIADKDNQVIRSIADGAEECVMDSVLELDTLRRKLQDNEDSQLCKVCFSRRRKCLFVPCCHLVCCAPCADRVQKCPVCCEPIANVYRVYEA
eukprot:GEMP01012330.1.p1 GENE.GEMP01012330.1~~GEMP01012330.1.p1  ORF type:complete len:408 (-),score=110.43 GEMP01012330.1:1640-2863(-)